MSNRSSVAMSMPLEGRDMSFLNRDSAESKRRGISTLTFDSAIRSERPGFSPSQASSKPGLSKHSSIASRVESANSTVNTKQLYGVALFIFLTLTITNGLVYVIVEYGLFGGNTTWNYDQGPGEQIEQLLALFCGGQGECWTLNPSFSSPTANLTDFQYLVYVGFIVYATVELTGLGMELLVWLLYLQSGWSVETENRWKLAQFVFPLLGITSIGLAHTHNYLSLIFLVLFLWKFGFPETILYIYSALYEKDQTKAQRIVDFLNGIGTVTHHSAGTMYVVFILIGVQPSNRFTLDVTLPLVMQHWFILVKYVNQWVYVVLELVLEAWFEWAALSNIEIMHRFHWTGGLIGGTMLFAHWMYLFAAGVHLVFVDQTHVEDNQMEQLHNIRASIRHLNVPRAMIQARQRTLSMQSSLNVISDAGEPDCPDDGEIPKDSSKNTILTSTSSSSRVQFASDEVDHDDDDDSMSKASDNSFQI